MNRTLILLVEDDFAIRETVSECLEAEGYRVHACEDGAVALEALQRGERPSVVVVDLVMPVMSGGELIERMRAEPGLRDLPVVLMTAALAEQDRVPAGADTILAKPFDLEQLLRAVSRHIGIAA